MKNEILGAVLDYAKAAGEIAIAEQKNLSAHLKPDDSYVTDVDLRLSELAFRSFSGVVPESQIVSEERLDNLRTVDEGRDSGNITVFIDPIDGTRNYFHNMPLYGISVGVFRDRIPWLGVVAFPGLDELFYCDDDNAYLVTGTFRGNRTQTILSGEDAELNTNAVVLLANSYVRKYRWSYDVCTAMVTACVSLNLCWPMLRRGIGTIIGDHIWDFAGSWPVLQHLGFEFRGIETGKRMERYDPGDYNPENLMLKEPVLVSRPNHFNALRQGVVEGAWVR
ncbi:MAG: hypothetical protein PF508_07060 [Spirochaeta sp.]|jgi:fructose-1,6-bisphosphatase/inositol monophosphatase family enzyme|nr:hypothetical protein [Spirochaeta sp.]